MVVHPPEHTAAVRQHLSLRHVARRSGRRAALRAALSSIGALLLAACASGPDLERVETVQSDSRVVVRYVQPNRDFRQTLFFDGELDPSHYYSSEDADPLAKILLQDQMQVLLDALAAKGLFEDARGSADPNAASILGVEIDGRSYVWSRTGSAPADEIRRYNEAMAVFLNLYNATESFHISRGQDEVMERHRENIRRYQNDLRRAKAGEDPRERDR